MHEHGFPAGWFPGQGFSASLTKVKQTLYADPDEAATCAVESR